MQRFPDACVAVGELLHECVVVEGQSPEVPAVVGLYQLVVALAEAVADDALPEACPVEEPR